MLQRNECPYCGSTMKSIKESGFVGCEHCYTHIDPLILAARDLFENKAFRGKPPKRRSHE